VNHVPVSFFHCFVHPGPASVPSGSKGNTHQSKTPKSKSTNFERFNLVASCVSTKLFSHLIFLAIEYVKSDNLGFISNMISKGFVMWL